MHTENLILGAGISGLGAAYALREAGRESVILEKTDCYGGLCVSFTIDGFTFDHFVHLSFAKDERVNRIFRAGSPEIVTHIPNPSNIYKGKWIKHPAQNNLYALDPVERELVIADFRKRPTEVLTPPENYEKWLRLQYGDYFAEHFPMAYTRKYWMKEACELRTEWVGNRLYQPSLEEVIAGSLQEDKRVTYYAKEMRYPQSGGYASYLKVLAENADIRYNAAVKSIDTQLKVVTDVLGNKYEYERLISSIPLPLLIKAVENVPAEVKEAALQLEATSGYHISVALKTKNIPPYLWWYIYDEDILAARVYSPSLKSSANAPEGCSSLQMEVYCKEGAYTESRLIEGTVGKLVSLGLIAEEDILFTHVGFEPFANVIFSQPVYEVRDKVRNYLKSVNIETIGRFGEWGYLWSDQSLLSGLNILV
ncbi:MAG: FAD-dependent oxidoreductase [Bacteroidales bacterium]|nr:FAD-dependent oxidoreductase [Bacteroidales bacterium]